MSSKVQYLSTKPFIFMFFLNTKGGKKKKMLFCNLDKESQTTVVCWALNGYLSTLLYKQTVIHC